MEREKEKDENSGQETRLGERSGVSGGRGQDGTTHAPL